MALVAQNQKSDCMEMLGNMVNTGDRVVGVSGNMVTTGDRVVGVSGLIKSPWTFFSQFCRPSQTAATVNAFVNQDFS